MEPGFRALLHAFADTFMGQRERALERAAEAGRDDLPPLVDGLGWFRSSLAAVHAWNGDVAGAHRVLEQLRHERPMLGRSLHTLDPLLAQPLSGPANP